MYNEDTDGTNVPEVSSQNSIYCASFGILGCHRSPKLGISLSAATPLIVGSQFSCFRADKGLLLSLDSSAWERICGQVELDKIDYRFTARAVIALFTTGQQSAEHDSLDRKKDPGKETVSNQLKN